MNIGHACRNVLRKLGQSEELWKDFQEERCTDSPDSIVPSIVARGHDAQGSAEPDMHFLTAQPEASLLNDPSMPNCKLAATEEGIGEQGALHSVCNVKGVWRWSNVEEMVIYGLGSMEDDRAPRYQLAFALLLAGRLPGLRGPIQVFDPRFTELDCMLLREQGCLVSPPSIRATLGLYLLLPCCWASTDCLPCTASIGNL